MPRSAPPDASAASADEAPPPQDGWSEGLPALRAELDRIDDALHALLMQRAHVVEQVARSGKRGAYRPGREASIIRRLLQRHRGTLPAQAVVRIWRELLAGTTAMQGPFAVAVLEPEGGAIFAQAAREHFGALTPLAVHRSAVEALAAVKRGTASVAVLPMPSQNDDVHDAWWTALLQADGPRLHIVARLPFWVRCNDAPAAAQALVVAATEPDPSGCDRSLLGLELAPEVSRAQLNAALTTAGLPPVTVSLDSEPRVLVVHALVEIDGFLTAGDPRLARLDAVSRRPVVLGAYAIPETGSSA